MHILLIPCIYYIRSSPQFFSAKDILKYVSYLSFAGSFFGDYIPRNGTGLQTAHILNFMRHL